MGATVMQGEFGDRERHSRTSQQNRALHKWFRQIAAEMDAAGYDVQATFTMPVQITEHNIKENMFKVITKHMYGKDSTAELSTQEIKGAVDVLQRLLAERYTIDAPFPGDAL